MKKGKMCLLLVLIFVCLLFSSNVFATPPAPIVKHEKIVAADGSGNFKTIGEALASITDASPTNRYRITVRPGVYGGFETKEYVDVVGSGQNNTIINSSVTVWHNSVVENIWISIDYAGVELLGNSPKLRRVMITGSVGIVDRSLAAEIEDVTIDITSSFAEALQIMEGGSPTIKNSTIINNGVDAIRQQAAGGNMKIINCKIKSNATGIALWYLPWEESRGTIIEIISSTVIGNQMSINNMDTISSFKMVNTQLVGNHNATAGRDKMLNCYDQNYNPLPNL